MPEKKSANEMTISEIAVALARGEITVIDAITAKKRIEAAQKKLTAGEKENPVTTVPRPANKDTEINDFESPNSNQPITGTKKPK